jgi:hypothetical protein
MADGHKLRWEKQEGRLVPPLVEDAAVWISIATVPSLIITYCAWIRRPGNARTIILYMAGSVAIAAYTLDVADRLDWISLSNKGPVVQQFGVKGAPETNNNALYVIVNSAPLLKYQDKFNMMLIAASMYSNIDMMTDVRIDKSSPFFNHRRYNKTSLSPLTLEQHTFLFRNLPT